MLTGRTLGTGRTGRTLLTGRTLGTDGTGRTLLALIALVAFVTLVTLLAVFTIDAIFAVNSDSLIIGLFAILIPVAVRSDCPGCAGGTVFAVEAVLAIGKSISLSIAESDVDTVSSRLYVGDDGAALDELLEFSQAYVDTINLSLQIVDIIIVVRTGGEAE